MRVVCCLDITPKMATHASPVPWHRSDPNGELASGGHVGSPRDLRDALSRQPAKFVQTVTEKLMTYALGRTVEYYDMPTIRAIVRESARHHYSFASIVNGVAESPAFRMRSVPSVDNAESVAATAPR